MGHMAQAADESYRQGRHAAELARIAGKEYDAKAMMHAAGEYVQALPPVFRVPQDTPTYHECFCRGYRDVYAAVGLLELQHKRDALTYVADDALDKITVEYLYHQVARMPGDLSSATTSLHSLTLRQLSALEDLAAIVLHHMAGYPHTPAIWSDETISALVCALDAYTGTKH